MRRKLYCMYDAGGWRVGVGVGVLAFFLQTSEVNAKHITSMPPKPFH